MPAAAKAAANDAGNFVGEILKIIFFICFQFLFLPLVTTMLHDLTRFVIHVESAMPWRLAAIVSPFDRL
jgi:hypothetical protein